MLIVGGFFAAGFLTEAAFPGTAEPRAYVYMLALCLWPFFLFYRWAKPSGVPLWKECLFMLASPSGLLAIHEALLHFGEGTKWWRWLALIGPAWGILCNQVYVRWIRTQRAAT